MIDAYTDKWNSGNRGRGEILGELATIFIGLTKAGQLPKVNAVSKIDNAVPDVPRGTVAGTTPRTNPGFPGTGRTQNCVNCAIATDSTFAGSAASAMPSIRPLPIKLVSDARSGRWFSIQDRSLIEHVMGELGPGARGVVYGNRGRTAHVFNVVVDSHGRVKFFDGQSMTQPVWDGFCEFKLLITNAPN